MNQWKAVALKSASLSFLFNKSTQHTIYPNLFCHKSLHVSDNFFAHHQESPIVHSAVQYSRRLLMMSKEVARDM